MKCRTCGEEDCVMVCAVCGDPVCYDCAKHSDVLNEPVCATCKVKEVTDYAKGLENRR